MVTLPMAKPGIIVASLYTFLGSMEEEKGNFPIREIFWTQEIV
jgi:putative spermidine/putrescine transport system permease protein